MKKCLISTLVILSGLYVSPCNAVVSLQTCPGTSITVGTKCNTLTGGLQSFLMDTSCQDPLTGGIKDSCLVYLCDGTCVCRTTPCTQIIDPDPILSCDASCFTNISWGSPSRTGRQEGTATVSTGVKCTGCPTTLYRCADGYYTTSKTLASLGLPDGTTDDSSLTCAACPSADDDTSFYYGAPSYVASKNGFASQSECYIKANSAINNDVGTYVYTSNCAYSTLTTLN